MANFHRHHGILPPHMVDVLVQQDPVKYLAFGDVAQKTRQLLIKSAAFRNPYFRFAPRTGASFIKVYDCERRTRRPGKKARFDGDAPSADQVVNNAYDFTEVVRRFYREIHNRHGIDAHDMDMISSVHYDEDYPNAFWDGAQMTYGDGDGDVFANFVLLDVCAHEITHGVTEFAAGTEYYGQSGALNEHFSDVWGESIEAYFRGESVGKMNWVVGNGIFMPGVKGDGIRNMLRPGTAYNDPRLGKDPQPDHMDRYVRTSSDNGGVHYNSGIPNRAFALFGLELGGYIWEKACKIWYAARVPAGSNPSFAQFAHHTVEACKALGWESDVPKLVKAWESVGIKPNKLEGDSLTPPLVLGQAA